MPFDLKTLVRLIDPRRSWTGYLVAAGVGLAIGLATLDPSASEGLGFAASLIFWLVHVFVAIAVLEIAQIVVGRAPWLRDRPAWAQVVLAGFLGAAMFAPIALAPETLLAWAGLVETADPFTSAELLEEARFSAGSVTTFWVILNVPRLLIIAEQNASAPAAPDAAPAEPAAPEPPRAGEGGGATRGPVELYARLPLSIGRDLVALSAELHYLRVYTARGDSLILMSFGRAVDSLRSLQGMAIHRSHWVALRHVDRVESDAGGAACRCVLSTGFSLPVSRPYRAALRAALRTHRERSDAGPFVLPRDYSKTPQQTTPSFPV